MYGCSGQYLSTKSRLKKMRVKTLNFRILHYDNFWKKGRKKRPPQLSRFFQVTSPKKTLDDCTPVKSFWKISWIKYAGKNSIFGNSKTHCRQKKLSCKPLLFCRYSSWWVIQWALDGCTPVNNFWGKHFWEKRRQKTFQKWHFKTN